MQKLIENVEKMIIKKFERKKVKKKKTPAHTQFN